MGYEWLLVVVGVANFAHHQWVISRGLPLQQQQQRRNDHQQLHIGRKEGRKDGRKDGIEFKSKIYHL